MKFVPLNWSESLTSKVWNILNLMLVVFELVLGVFKSCLNLEDRIAQNECIIKILRFLRAFSFEGSKSLQLNFRVDFYSVSSETQIIP